MEVKMNRPNTHMLALLVAVGVGVILSGCASTRIKRLSGTEFLNQAIEIDQLNSFHWTTYVGMSNKRAYLEFGYPALVGRGTRTTLFWTQLSELPDDVVEKLKSGNSPWKPWRRERE